MVYNSSTEEVVISGTLDKLESAIDFTFRFTEWVDAFTRKGDPAKCVFQIANDGRCCLGSIFKSSKDTEGWTIFPFEYDLKAISIVVSQHLKNMQDKLKYPDEDCFELGFRLKIGDEDESDIDEFTLKNSHHCILHIQPIWIEFPK